jgi:hypothetical protein
MGIENLVTGEDATAEDVLDLLPSAFNLPLLGDIENVGSWGVTWDITYVAGVMLYQNFPGNGNYVTFPFKVKAGTYAIRVGAVLSSTHGIVDIYVDGVEVGSQDLYASPDSWTTKQITGLALAAGEHTIKFMIDGKNVSSTDYQSFINFCCIYRTGA